MHVEETDMAMSARLMEVFLEVQRGLPRQGPGCAASTLAALALCRGLPERPAVLDIGCGPGLQTLTLARTLAGPPIAALDLFLEYLDQLRARAAADGVDGRIAAVVGDMTALPFSGPRFDLIWSEGAAYIMGFAAAVEAWRRLLRPGGFLVVSDLVWLLADPPAEAVAMWAEEYPAMCDVETRIAEVRQAGLTYLNSVPIPEAGWWDDYYTPLAAKLPALKDAWQGDADALAIIDATEREIDTRRRFGASYGYVLFAARTEGRGEV